MKLNELLIENFGIFGQKTLKTDSPFCLIYGPNEAGKSTLLQLIRESLFGFSHRNPYLFQDHTGTMAAEVQATLASGREFRFRRRKARKTPVTGEFIDNGESIDEEQLRTLLGGATADLFQHVFGFSLRELADGEASLKKANLQEALYGGGLGNLAKFQDVREKIKSAHSTLYTARGRGGRIINKLLEEISTQSTELRRHLAEPEEYVRKKNELKQIEQRVEQLRQKELALGSHTRELESLKKAITARNFLQQAEADLVALDIPDDLSESVVERARSLHQQCEQQRQDMEQLQDSLAAKKLSLQQVQHRLAPQVIQSAGEIRELFGLCGRFEELADELPEARADAEEKLAEVKLLLKDLMPDWSVEQLKDWPIGEEQRLRLRKLQDEFRRRIRELTEQRSKRDSLQGQIQSEEGQLQALPDNEDEGRLHFLVERGEELVKDIERRQMLEDEIDQQSRIVQSACRDVLQPLAASCNLDPADARTLETLLTLQVPLKPTIEEHAERIEQRQREFDAQHQKTESLCESLDEKREALQQFHDAQNVVTVEQLQQLRQTRDEKWQQLKSAYIEKNLPKEELTTDPLDYESSVHHADELADARQAQSEDAARYEQMQADIQSLQKKIDRERTKLTKAQDRLADAQASWRQLWNECPFEPQSPRAMLDWLERLKLLKQQADRLDKTQAGFERLNEKVSDAEAELLKAVPESQFDDGRAAWQTLKKRLSDNQQNSARRETLSRAIADKKRQLEKIETQVSQLEAEHEQAETQLQKILSELQLPETADVDSAERLVTQLCDLRKDLRQAEEQAARVRKGEDELGEFTDRVAELCRTIAPDLQALPPHEAVQELEKREREAREAESQHRNLEHELKLLQQRIDQLTPRMEDNSGVLQQLLNKAGTESWEAFEEIASRLADRTKLQQRVRELKKEFDEQVAGAVQQDEFREKAERRSVHDVEAELEQLERERSDVSQELLEVRDQLAVARRELETVDSRVESLRLSQELEGLRADFVRHVGRWAPLVLVDTLMDRALASFERNHQPELIRTVSELFQRITGGRYSRIVRSLSTENELVVLDRHEQRRRPDQLSTGTREQLYLAIRLGYIMHYCRTTEPLPIVMDDVLVNFDIDRAQQTLEVLSDISQDCQILFLTCHSHMVSLVNQVIPDSRVIHLQESSETTSGRKPAKHSSVADEK